MKITAKIHLRHSVEVRGADTEYEQHVLTFVPDYADGRNKEWAVATPALSLTMSVRPDVAAKFVPGGAYTLTFEPDEQDTDADTPTPAEDVA